MMGRKSPDGTAIPKVISPSMQYSAKKIMMEEGWYSRGVLVERLIMLDPKPKLKLGHSFELMWALMHALDIIMSYVCV